MVSSSSTISTFVTRYSRLVARTDYDELRAAFTAAVSHELRTPLARLHALLESAELPGADLHALLRQAREEVDEMTELVDDVLFLSELEEGREVVALGETEAAPVVREVVAELAERAELAGLRLELRIEDDTLKVPLRQRMLRLVVENLLENAIRYAGEGATCTVSLDRADGGVVLDVADDGAGVPDEDVPRLFERFFRSDRARTTRGTGLGLAIVKHVVESAGGNVEARGGRGRGLDVRCVLPA
jgi:two-component system phosphate regulon sensor histidine kinase PhoR